MTETRTKPYRNLYEFDLTEEQLEIMRPAIDEGLHRIRSDSGDAFVIAAQVKIHEDGRATVRCRLYEGEQAYDLVVSIKQITSAHVEEVSHD